MTPLHKQPFLPKFEHDPMADMSPLMFDLLCTALAAEITDIPAFVCERIGQVVKIGFSRVYSTGVTVNEFVIATANPNLIASWTTVLAASDGTKVQMTPYLHEAVLTEGEARETSGGAADVDGIPEFLDLTHSTFEGKIRNAKQDLIVALKDYSAESSINIGNLGVYLVNKAGLIWGTTDSLASPTKFRPIPIQSFSITDKGAPGLEAKDHNGFKFYLAPNWSDTLYPVTPTDFGARVDLVNP